MGTQLERSKEFGEWKNLNTDGEKEQTLVRNIPAIDYITSVLSV